MRAEGEGQPRQRVPYDPDFTPILPRFSTPIFHALALALAALALALALAFHAPRTASQCKVRPKKETSASTRIAATIATALTRNHNKTY